MSKQPPPAPTASAVGPCPTRIQISRTPQHWKFTQHHRTTRPPPNMKVCCLFSIRVHTIYHFQYKIENHPKLTQICSYGIFFQWTQEQFQNSRGKGAISVRAIEVLLYTGTEKYHKVSEAYHEVSKQIYKSYPFMDGAG